MGKSPLPPFVLSKMTKNDLIEFEEKVAQSFERGEIKCPIHLSGGNEEALIELFKHIHKDDWVFSTHRNHYHYLLHTGDKEGLWNEITKAGDGDSEVSGGVCRGNSGSMHTCNISRHFVGSAIVGGCTSIAVGVALALKRNKSKRKVWCFVGDGATDSGWFFEALRYAQNYDLPITFVVEDNNRSVETTKEDRWNESTLWCNHMDKVIYYCYIPKWPHVGCGKYVTF